MKKNILILASLFCVLSLRAQDEGPAFGDTERLRFRVSYRAKMFPDSEVATVNLDATRRKSGNFEIIGTGKTSSFVKWFFQLNDKYTTILSGTTLRPVEASCELKEGKYHFKSKQTFDWGNMEVNSTWRNYKFPNDNYKTMPLTSRSFDALGLFYNLRNTPVEDFVQGAYRPLDLVLEDSVRRILFKFIGPERIAIKNMGIFNSLKFSCQLATSDGERYEDGSEFYIWISDDRNRIPLKIDSPIKVGSISARLVEFSGLRFPLESKVE